MSAHVPRRLVPYFDAQPLGDTVRLRCKNGHVATAAVGKEDEALWRMAQEHGSCRFCKKVLG